jgi:hypothetical protein
VVGSQDLPASVRRGWETGGKEGVKVVQGGSPSVVMVTRITVTTRSSPEMRYGFPMALGVNLLPYPSEYYEAVSLPG